MNETKPSVTKPKKMVSRKVAVALGIVCIVLVAGLGSAIMYYTITINDRDQIINLTKFTDWLNISEPILSTSTPNWTFTADYAGYISVQVYNSIGEVSANVVYSYQGINYDQQLEGTTEVFPVMPSNIEITVSDNYYNLYVPSPAYYTIIILYYY